MHRYRTRPHQKRNRPPAAGNHAPRLIGYGILIAALLFIVIGLMTA
jgi:hypothetical protein